MSGYNTECPACHELSYYFTPHNNFGYCFRPSCGYYCGSDITSARIITRSKYKEEIRAYYTKMSHYYHSCLTKEAEQYLLNRGYTLELIQKKKIGYCPPGKSHLYKGIIPQEAGLSLKNGNGFFADRITFPYIVNDTEISDIRARYITKKREEVKYKSPYNSYYQRWSDYPYNYYLHNNQKLLLTESEIKADIAVSLGYACIGLPGMNIWKSGWVIKDTQEVTIVFDNQRRNYNQVQKSIENAANHFTNVKVAVLPLLGKDKAEIDTFVLEQGKDFFDMVIRNAIPYESWRKLQQ